MLAAITSFLGGLNWAAVGAFFVGIAGVVFGMFRNEQAKSKTAKAEQKVAQKDAEVAAGNAAASQAAAKASAAAHRASVVTKKIKNADLDKVGEELGILREDK